MSELINGFLALPMWGRSAIVLALFIGIFWLIFGKVLIRVLSLIPFLLNKLFCGLYFIIELPIDFLHSKIGGNFFEVENRMSRFAERISALLQRWYTAWRHPQKVHVALAAVFYLLLVAFVGFLPMVVNDTVSPLSAGGNFYLKQEDSFIKWLENKGWFVRDETILENSVIVQLDNTHILRNGTLEEIGLPPIEISDKAYFPIGDMVTVLDGTVEWDSATQSILFTLSGEKARLHAASGILYLNNREIVLNDKPVEKDSRVYVGGREFLELLGYRVQWFGTDRIIVISSSIDANISSSLLQKIREEISVGG